MISRSELRITSIHVTAPTTTTFELQPVIVRSHKRSFTLLNIYRPPTTAPTSAFFAELSDLLVSMELRYKHPVIICGDLNCRGTSCNTTDERLSQALTDLGYMQHVSCATRENSLLDIIATKTSDDLIHRVKVQDSYQMSDHCLITCDVNDSLPKSEVSTFTWRALKGMDYAALDIQLGKSPLLSEPVAPDYDVDKYLSDVNSLVVSALDTTAPLKTRRRTCSRAPTDAFMAPEAVASKRKRRRLERLWKRTGSDRVRKLYREACRSTNRVINQSRAKVLADRINIARNYGKLRWREFNNLLHVKRCSGEGPKGRPKSFAVDYSKFLLDKINTLQLKCLALLHSVSNSVTFNSFEMPFFGTQLSSLKPVTKAEVANLINTTQLKSSPNDVFPSSLIKSCHNSFSIIIANLANLSFAQGRFPQSFKTAQITPLLKKPNLDASDLANYRPISNLSTTSKLLERLALSRLSPHLLSSKNFNPFQSAYRKKHSTETALLNTLSDFYAHIDSGASVLAISLDLSSAFDTVPHNKLLHRLQHTFGITDTALSWLESYLSDRHQYVYAENVSSPALPVTTGVPQGSVLGPLLFSAYTCPLHHLISSYGLNHQQYADDTIVYSTVPPNSHFHAVSNLERCVSTLCLWFADNGLSVNPSKSDAALFSTRQRLQKHKTSGLKTVNILDSIIPISDTLTVLGVTLDSSLSFDKHCSKTVQSCLYHLRALRHIRPLLNTSDAELLSCCLVQSRLDYCNSLLAHTSKDNLHKLQRMQNSAARLTYAYNSTHHSPSQSILADHHWLPVTQRITFKVATITHSVTTCREPGYLQALLIPYDPARPLRSSCASLLSTPRTHLTLSDQSFSIMAPKTWNSLSLSLRTTSSHEAFRKNLKTELFRNTPSS